MKKAMISQPMKDLAKEEIEKNRMNAVSELNAEGYCVIDTIFAKDAEEAKNEPVWFLSKSIEAMSGVDLVYFLKGWKNARGCRIEHEIAIQYGIPIEEEES